jgi:hypothetical protein
MGQRPSLLVNLTDDPWTAYQLDTAVATLGQVIEGALQEMHNVGSEKEPRWEPRYSLSQLLEPAFRLPKEGQQQRALSTAQADAAAALKAMTGKGVKVFKAKG